VGEVSHTDLLTSDLTWDCTEDAAAGTWTRARVHCGEQTRVVHPDAARPTAHMDCSVAPLTWARFARCCTPHHVSSRVVCLHASPLVATHTQLTYHLTCAISVPASSFSMCSTRQAEAQASPSCLGTGCGAISTSDHVCMLACPLLWDARIGLHTACPFAACLSRGYLRCVHP
jgi:hypothetical protein